ncbi:MAG: hypothetical protein HY913_16805 [Desulfomonile tiedjei]|nr:hypothetical protein [Desulfomonile tiedjei]
MRHLFHKVNSTALAAILLGLLGTLFLVHVSTPRAIAAQTREQCDRCCEKAGHDEYFMEQCKLKCFRNSDHCSGGKAAQSPAPEGAPSPRTIAPPSAQPKAAVPPPAQPGATPPGPPAQPKAAFRFPDSLSLVPGREQEAAGQILALNGIPPQHPNFPAALAAVQSILVEFARANPTGGRLPTAQLERAIRQFRQ